MAQDTGGPERSFQDRLNAARGKQGLDAPPKPPGFDPGATEKSALGIGLRVGLELVSALVVAVAIGWGLDRWFGTAPILMLVFLPLGGAAGIVNVYRTFAPKPDEDTKTPVTKPPVNKT